MTSTIQADTPQVAEFYINRPPGEVARELTSLFGQYGIYHQHPHPVKGIAKLYSIHYFPEPEEGRRKVLVLAGNVFNNPVGIVGIVYSTEENPNMSIGNTQPSHEESSKINLESITSLGLEVHR
jgi:hypothetical protein